MYRDGLDGVVTAVDAAHWRKPLPDWRGAGDSPVERGPPRPSSASASASALDWAGVTTGVPQTSDLAPKGAVLRPGWSGAGEGS